MNKELAKFISEANFRLKESLAAVIKKEFTSLELSRPLAEMKVTEVVTMYPQMEEWFLSRLFNMFGDRKLMDDVIERLCGHNSFAAALIVAGEALHDIYCQIEEKSVNARKLAAYRKGLHGKSFLGGQKFGFIVNCEHRMVTLEVFVEERGSLPDGEFLVIDKARNVFSVKFVKSLKEVLSHEAVYYFWAEKKKPEAKLIF